MRGITITYTYSGDEGQWRSAIDTFLTAIDADTRLTGRFTYQVAVADDGSTRIHWGRWDEKATVDHLQAQPFFKTFAGHVKAFAGDSLRNTPHDVVTKTSGW